METKRNLHILNTVSGGSDFKKLVNKLGFGSVDTITPSFVLSCWKLIDDFKHPTIYQYERAYEEWGMDLLKADFSKYENIYIWQENHNMNTQMFLYMMCALTDCKLQIVDATPMLDYRNNLNRAVFRRELKPSEIQELICEIPHKSIMRIPNPYTIHEVKLEEHTHYASEWQRLLQTDTGLRAYQADGTIINIPIDSLDNVLMHYVNQTEQFTNVMHIIFDVLKDTNHYNPAIFGEKFDESKYDYSFFFYFWRLQELIRQGKMQLRLDKERWEAQKPIDTEYLSPKDFVDGVCIAFHNFIEIKKL